MKANTRMMLATVVAMAATKASATVLTIDNFEEYTNNQAIATSATSTPWLRFGSVGDNFYATNNSSRLLDGTLSGDIPVAISTASGSATLRKNFVTATDLSSYLSATVLSKSSASAPSTAALQLSIADATTTYLTTVSVAETLSANTYTFSLASGAFTLAAGTDSFATVLSQDTSIGFRISNYGSATATNEVIDFDDFALQTNPTSVYTPTGAGDFNVASNWNTGIVPSGIGYEADLSSSITAPHTVYSDTPITLGTLSFNNTNMYNLTGAGTLTMQTSSGAASVIVAAGTQKINLPLTIASNTTFNVASGSTLLIANPLTINAGKTLTSTGTGTVTYQSLITVGTGGSITFSNSTVAAGLTLNASANAIVASAGSTKTILQLNALSLDPTSMVDLTTSGLVVHGGSLSSVTASVASGFASGTWLGTGITSSAAAADASHLTALGVGTSGSDVVVKYTYFGDANLDGKVDASDYSRIDSAFVSGSSTGWNNGDFNYDGVVNGSDYTLIDNAFNSQGAQFASEIAATNTAEIASSTSAVPEPASLGLLAAAGILSVRARRRLI